MSLQKEALIRHWRLSGLITDEKVLEAFRLVPREEFVPPEMEANAYDDDALPLFEGQTISQPTTVMIMAQALEAKEGMKVFEVGTGSGYNAALLSHLAGPEGTVVTTEILPSLHKFAKANLKQYKNVVVVKADGMLGFKNEAPYDRIIITAATPEISTELQDQLKLGGIIVAPLGSGHSQQMMKMKKTKEGFKKEYLGEFAFVPLAGKYGE